MPIDEALICDADMTRQFEAQMRLEADPLADASGGNNRGNDRDNRQSDNPQGGWSSGQRVGIVHVTSTGDKTQDYPCMSIDLRDHDLTLGDVARGQRLTYDYHAGEHHTGRIPGEAFLTLRVTDSETDEERHVVAFRSANDDRPMVQWRRRVLSQEIRQDGWRALELDSDFVDAEEERVRKTIATGVIEEKIGQLRQQQPFQDLVGRYGQDTAVLGVTIGVGNVTDATTLDAYFHNVRVVGQSHMVPAMLTMDPTFEKQDNGLNVSLTFPNAELGLNSDAINIDEASVHLSEYASIARPIDGTAVWENAVQAENVEIQDETIHAHFTGDLEVFGDASLVYGAISHDHNWPLTFLATRETEWSN